MTTNPRTMRHQQYDSNPGGNSRAAARLAAEIASLRTKLAASRLERT
jgi:hypothetical protein